MSDHAGPWIGVACLLAVLCFWLAGRLSFSSALAISAGVTTATFPDRWPVIFGAVIVGTVFFQCLRGRA